MAVRNFYEGLHIVSLLMLTLLIIGKDSLDSRKFQLTLVQEESFAVASNVLLILLRTAYFQLGAFFRNLQIGTAGMKLRAYNLYVRVLDAFSSIKPKTSDLHKQS